MTDEVDSNRTVGGIGPVLHMRGLRDGRVHLAALVVRPESEPAPPLITDAGEVAAATVYAFRGYRADQYRFSLPARSDASYRLDGATYTVDAAFDGDLRVAFVSCNGQEEGDRHRPIAERDALWARLARQHADSPFQLLLHGGDQIYADEILDAHPAVRDWADARGAPADPGVDQDAVADALRAALFARYLELYSHSEFAWLAARLPSATMWDDHDICDGWGSLEEAKLDAPTGRTLFAVTRELFLLFQCGAATDALPETCLDPSGTSLSWHLKLPGLQVLAPDLRSERRPRRVMGERGWRAFRAACAEMRETRVLVLSSVPALGPRLSWVEAAMSLTPSMEKYEDDLRDQWQSRAHRAEWRSFLRQLIDVHRRADTRVTVLSGEIHLATRATLATAEGPLHQLVASGITHPPPPTYYARTLGALARLGETPLPHHPIRLHPLPGMSAIYTDQRNYLVLERRDGGWCARWELEETGATPALNLD